MRGLLTLEPDESTRNGLVAVGNRLRDGLTRQGVHFVEPERLGPTLLAWPFARFEELDEAIDLLEPVGGEFRLGPLTGRPNDDRPAEIGYAVEGLGEIQSTLFARLKQTLDPDPPKPAFVRLARVSPPSRKVGIALRSLGGFEGPGNFTAIGLALWNQSPQGYEVYRTMVWTNDRP